jgi:uncharacterized protein (DUF2267 family)
MTQPYDVQYASEQFQDWLLALKQKAMLQTHNQSQAIFRAVLQGLRRHQTTEQVLNFADALPPLPRGIFVEGWRPTNPSPVNSTEDFIQEVMESLAPHHVPPTSIVADVFAVLAERSDPVKGRTMREQLPKQLQALWP